MNTWQRTIIHVDMDAFFAAIEQRDRPELRNRPVIVGGGPNRGVVSTASYEARRYGIHSAMPTARALKLCPDATLISPNHKHYAEVSAQVHRIFRDHTETLEPLSLDEAYLDVSRTDSIAIAVNIKKRIRDELQLTASVGLSYNKFLAKLGSDMDKPDGLTIITPARAKKMLPHLSIRDLPGIGPKTEHQLNKAGIYKISDLLSLRENYLSSLLGSRALQLLSFARGQDDRPVVTQRLPKSFGEETTFRRDVTDMGHIKAVLGAFAHDLAARLHVAAMHAHTVSIKCRYPDFTTATRQLSQNTPITTPQQITGIAHHLLTRLPRTGPVRLIGLQVFSLNSINTTYQQSLPVDSN